VDWTDQVSLFLLGFSSLLPLINPIGTALIVNPYFAGATWEERKSATLFICTASLSLGIAVLFGGSWALKFMGISIPVTQMGGGILIAHMGMGMLTKEAEGTSGGSGSNGNGGRDGRDSGPSHTLAQSLFYPLAFPLTLGPGGISVLITLSAHAHSHVGGDQVTLERMAVLALSLLATLAITYICLVYSKIVISRIGNNGSIILNRLMAFLVFCIGIQMLVGGLSAAFPQLFH